MLSIYDGSFFSYLSKSVTFLFAILAMSFSSAAHSTVVVVDELSTMTKRSEIIAQAGVVGQESKIDPQGRIITLTTLEIIDGIKGVGTGEHITIYQVGGEVDGRVLNISGAQKYILGEELFIFGLHMDDKVVSYGLGLGKFRVDRSDTGDLVVEDISDLIVAKLGKNGEMVLGEPKPRVFQTVRSFKSEILKSLKPNIKNTLQPLQLKPFRGDDETRRPPLMKNDEAVR